MSLHGTTRFAADATPNGNWSRGLICADCGRPVTNYATRCSSCRREREETIKRNRRRFTRHAAETSHEEKVILAQRQTVRLCDMAAMEVGDE